jgi:gamma-glutamylcyclotransferase (GGCT)/AIG2-like uncharacterized protein YtfP
MNYVFVYGTLKRGEQNHVLLRGSEFVDVGYVRGCVLFDLGGCPAMMPGGNRQIDEVTHSAKGEIYEVPDEVFNDTLARLDRLESEGSLYLRVKLIVRTRTGGSCECLTYLFIPSLQGNQRVVNGGWWSGRDALK